jgi:Mat/Ecp fimbriae major subunit
MAVGAHSGPEKNSGDLMTSKIYSAALAATAVLAAALVPAAAQAATDSAEARARVLAALTLANTSALEFGAVVASGVAGSVQIAVGGGRTCGGGITCSGTVSAAGFDVTGGTAGENVTINADPSVTLNGPGGATMTASLVESAAVVQLDATGEATFTVGGTLTVGANQAQGNYVGNFDVTADYQ